MAILVGRLVLFGTVLSGFQNIPILQTLSLFLINASYVTILAKVKPFVSKTVYFSTVIAGNFNSYLFRKLFPTFFLMLHPNSH